MSIVRVGMAEDGKFGDGYEAIFGKKQARRSAKKAVARKSSAKKPAIGKGSGKKR